MKLGRAALAAIAVLVVGCSSAPTEAVTNEVTVTQTDKVTQTTTVPTTVVSSAAVKDEAGCTGNADAVKIYEEALRNGVAEIQKIRMGSAVEQDAIDVLVNGLTEGYAARNC